jgi:hypothetical protein
MVHRYRYCDRCRDRSDSISLNTLCCNVKCRCQCVPFPGTCNRSDRGCRSCRTAPSPATPRVPADRAERRSACVSNALSCRDSRSGRLDCAWLMRVTVCRWVLSVVDGEQ